MTTWLYDLNPPPPWIYTKATSAYTTLVQLYAGSGQLPTADGMYQKKTISSRACRFGCLDTENHVISLSFVDVFPICATKSMLLSPFPSKGGLIMPPLILLTSHYLLSRAFSFIYLTTNTDTSRLTYCRWFLFNVVTWGSGS